MSYRTITLKFGLVNIVVGVDSAITKAESLKNVCQGLEGHEHVTTALKQPKLRCPVCQTEAGEFTKKAQAVGRGFKVIDTATVEDARDAAVGLTKTDVTLSIHPAVEVDTQTIAAGGVYYLSPDGPGWVESLSLLVDTVRRNPQYAYTCMFAPSGRVNEYRLGLFGDTLILQELGRTEDLKVVQQPLVPVNPVNAKLMDATVKQNVIPYDPETYRDTYLVALDAAFEASDTVPGSRSVNSGSSIPAGVLDLTALLASGIKAKPKARKPRARKVVA